jgi:TonB family protein
VRFSLLDHLIASGPKASSWREELPPGMATVAVYLAALLYFVFVQPPMTTTEPIPETVTYLDVPPPTAVRSPRAVVPIQPPVVRQGLRIPAVLPGVARAGMLAGFQELVPPGRLAGLPPVNLAQQTVSAMDFKGRGVAGGVAGGERPKEIPPPTDSTPQPVAMGRPYEAGVVHELPLLLNRADLPAILRDLYPPLLRLAGMGGGVRVEFVVEATGRVNLESIRVLESPHPLLTTATRSALERVRFRPGRVQAGADTRVVAVLVAMTIQWTLNDGGSR